MPDNEVGFLNPYRDTAMLYRAAGWRGTIPLPAGEKHPPPTGFTGHAAPYPTDDEITAWSDDGKKHNIGIRLAGVDKEHEIIGIDVDHYDSGDKEKRGGDQLRELEARLGVLPDTWVSSARSDGVSGIRYFRVPRGMAFRGQVDKDIECIQKGHRFAVVYPSKHPNGNVYRWHQPGTLPQQGAVFSQELPDARKLPLLPQQWLSYLTNDMMRAGDADIIDMQSSVGEIYDWADSTFHAVADEEFICSGLRKKLDKQVKDILESATSHDKIVKAHYNLFRLAAEGHIGWAAAVNIVEKTWADDIVDRDKRGLEELRGELFRSRVNALRKVKAQIDQRVAVGAQAVDPRCDITGMCGSTGEADATAGAVSADSSEPPDDPLADVPRGPIRPVDDYPMNDDGNAQHFIDQFSSIADGPAVRFVDGYGWITWHEGNSARQPHWELDVNGDQEVRRMWQKVRDRQMLYVDTLKMDYENQLAQAQGVTPVPANVKAARAKWQSWEKFSILSGNNKNAENALKAARSIQGVSMPVSALDQSPFLLGVGNGVVELDGENVRLRRAAVRDYITLNTNTPWEEPSKFSSEKWQEYLDTFLPDPDLQRTVQVALGHTLIGGNPEKIMIVLKGDPNTGKSTMVNAIEAALGDYAQSVSQTIFQNHKLNPVLARAIPKRVIVCSEFDEQDSLSASMLKRMTGGTDKIQAELKGSNITVEGVPQFVPILATNSVPSISGADKALKNRLYVIPFNEVPKRIRKESANVIQNVCGPAVLSWLIDGFKEYRRLGEMPTTQAIIEGTNEFASELDDISEFMYQCVEHGSPEDKVFESIMLNRFNRWWTEIGGNPSKQITGNILTRRLKGLGLHKHKNPAKNAMGVSERYWVGVRLKDLGANVINMPTFSDLKVKKDDA